MADVYVSIDNSEAPAGQREVGQGVILDINRDGDVLGVEILGAQKVTMDGHEARSTGARTGINRLAEHLADLTYRGRNLPPAHAQALAEFVLRFYDVRAKGDSR